MQRQTRSPQCAPVKVLVIDDHPLFRKGASQLLELDDEFELVGEAENGRQGIEQARLLNPDVVLLDLNMKDMDGLEVLQVLKRETADLLVVMLTVSDRRDHLVKALACGADGYLLKDMEPGDILEKLKKAVDGQVVLDEGMSSLLAKSVQQDPSRTLWQEPRLTNRERQILSLIARGMSNKLIARSLDISDGTVKVHVKNILRKLKMRSRLEAAVWAMDQGLGSDRARDAT